MNTVSLALIWPGEPAARQRSRAERHLQELMLFLSEAHSSLSATVRPVSAAVAGGAWRNSGRTKRETRSTLLSCMCLITPLGELCGDAAVARPGRSQGQAR